MREIYSRAEKVVSWLGEANGPGTGLAMEWIRRFGGWAAELGVGEEERMLLREVFGREERGEWADEVAFAKALKGSLDPEVNVEFAVLVCGLQDLLGRAYWARA